MDTESDWDPNIRVYDLNGRLVEKSQGTGYVEKWSYRADGQPLEHRWWYADILFAHTHTMYGVDGLPLRTEYGRMGEPDGLFRFIHEDGHLLTEMQDWEGDGKVEAQYHYTADTLDRWVLRTMEGVDGMEWWTEERTYDGISNRVTSTTRRSMEGSVLEKSTAVFDDAHRPVERRQKYYSDQRVYNTSVWTASYIGDSDVPEYEEVNNLHGPTYATETTFVRGRVVERRTGRVVDGVLKGETIETWDCP